MDLETNTKEIVRLDERKGGTSASNAYADSLCPGRHNAQRPVPEQADGAYSAHGTAIHKSLHDGNVNRLDFEQRETYDACESIRQKVVEQFFAGEAVTMTWKEQRIFCAVPPDKTGTDPLLHSAKPDFAARSATKLLLCEYKTLPGDVQDSESNLQLRDQAVLVGGSLVIPGDVGVCVIQPLVTHRPSITVYSPEDRKLAEAEMFARVRASNAVSAPRIPGQAQCKYCRAKASCVEYQQWAASMLPTVFDRGLFDLPVLNWTPEQRAQFMDQVGPAEKLLEEIKASIKSGLAANPAFCPGWSLEPGIVRHPINDANKAFERFAALGGTVEQFIKCVDVGKGELKAQLAGVTGKKGKALADVLETLLTGITDTKQNQPSLKKL